MVIKTGNARTWLFRLFKTEPSWKQWHCLAINGPFSSHGVVTRLNFRWQILLHLKTDSPNKWFRETSHHYANLPQVHYEARVLQNLNVFTTTQNYKAGVCKCPSLCDDHCCRWQTRLFTHHTQFVQIFGVVSEKLMPGRALDLETNRNWRRLLHCMC